MKRFLVLILVMTAVIGCSSSDDNRGNHERSVYIDGGENGSVARFIQKATVALKLEPYDSIVDEMEIRIWFTYGFSNRTRLLDLKLSKVNAATFFEFTYEGNKPSNDSVRILHLLKKDLEVSGDPEFKSIIKHLKKLKIDEILGMGDVVETKDIIIPDSDNVTIECKSRFSYCLYNYVAPWYYKKVSWQASNVIAILELINKEFQFFFPS